MAALIELLAILAVPAIAYLIYRRFLAPGPEKDKLIELAYEEGFRDAVRYFGVKKLYEEDEVLNRRMTEVFSEAGTPHKFADILKKRIN